MIESLYEIIYVIVYITFKWRIPKLRKFNIMRPLLILAVAYFAKNLTALICESLGASKALTGNLAFVAMMAAAIFTYMRMNKSKRNR
jgi:membrane associated rhomboid family serine protease